MIQHSVIIVGAGIFGVTAAIELNRRGFAVTIIARGNLPHPDASSTDISKMIRMDYGRDEFYMQLMEQAFAGWDKWNQEWDEPLYHEDGFLMMKRRPLKAGDYEYESLQHLQKRGHSNTIDKMTSQALAEKYPMWKAENYPDGYLNRRGGWAESGRVLAKLISIAQAEGVNFQTGAGFQQLMENDSQVIGIITDDGKKHHANFVVIATGAWTSVLFPELQDVMWATGQPVIHLRPENPEAFTPPKFLPWAADMEVSGWYGFAYHPHE
jgi:glycine/D-amino acid oxidase-like deaminating enzyme